MTPFSLLPSTTFGGKKELPSGIALIQEESISTEWLLEKINSKLPENKQINKIEYKKNINKWMYLH